MQLFWNDKNRTRRYDTMHLAFAAARDGRQPFVVYGSFKHATRVATRTLLRER